MERWAKCHDNDKGTPIENFEITEGMELGIRSDITCQGFLG
jgi:hypothetical protein